MIGGFGSIFLNWGYVSCEMCCEGVCCFEMFFVLFINCFVVLKFYKIVSNVSFDSVGVNLVIFVMYRF